MGRRYSIDFAMITAAGNQTRYEDLQRFVPADREVQARWYELNTYMTAGRADHLPKFARNKFRNATNISRLALRTKVDATVIHGYETYLHYAAIPTLLRRETVMVNNYDGTYRGDGTFGDGVQAPGPGVRGKLAKLALDKTDLFVPWSRFTADRTAAVYPEAVDRTIVIHPGLDLTRWKRRHTSPSNEGVRLLFVGGDFIRKGGDLLLPAIKAANVDNWSLDVITSADTIPIDILTVLQGSNNVNLHFGIKPNTQKLQELYAAVDIFVLPTRLDLSSLATLEAMATGVPVIVSAIGGIPEIAENECTALTTAAGDIGALANAIRRISNDHALRHRLVERARARVEQRFDADKNTVQLLSEVKKLIESHRRTPRV